MIILAREMSRCAGKGSPFRHSAVTFAVVLSLLATPTANEARAAAAQFDAASLKVAKSRVTGLASFVTAADAQAAIPVVRPDGQDQIEAIDFLRQYGSLFGITNAEQELVAENTTVDRLGWTHTTFSQVHRGVAVFAGVVKVHQRPDGSVYAANGDFFPIPSGLQTTAKIEASEAARIAAKSIELDKPTVEQAELVIVNPAWYGDADVGVHLAYYLILSDAQAGLRDAFFVDARKGSILDRWTLIHHAVDREIHDAAGEDDLPGPLARSEGDPPTGDPDTDGLYDYSGDLYMYYALAFGRDGYDDAGATQIGTANSTYANCPNAFWNGVQTAYCTGIATDDVVGHEWTHALTDFTANLIYQNQSGQLNESYSDVFGEMVDRFNSGTAFPGPPEGTPWELHPSGPGLDEPNNLRTQCSPGFDYPDGVRWLIGEDTAFEDGAIRDMWDPTCHGHPDRANSPLQTCPAGDSGGVHQGSGIPNHAFAMVTDGKSFNGYTISGMGPIKAGAVWYRALALYLTPASDFEDAYAGLNQAAADLIGTFPADPRTGQASGSMFTAANANEVDEALLAVEMNTPGACGQGNNVLRPDAVTLCPARTVIYEDDFESGAPGWTVSNSNPPTPYDWVLASGSLPSGRSGTVWFADDPVELGDCDSNDESGVHSLFSPLISLPDTSDVPMLTFTHFSGTEGGWDGGNVKLSVNEGAWQVVPRSAFEFNPYNGRLHTAGMESTNPMEGQVAWVGAGGPWGTSLIRLSGLAVGGDTIQIRFDLGKDGCNGIVGWFVDDFEVFTCPDCDADGSSDQRAFELAAASEVLLEVGGNSPVTFTLPSPPAATGEVTMSFTAFADLNSSDEYLEVEINDTAIGTLYEIEGSDCAFTPDSAAQIVVSAAVFNAAVSGGDAAITLEGTNAVDEELCGGSSYVTVFIEYAAAATDDNANNVPDECETGACCCGDGSCTEGQWPDVCETDICEEGDGSYQGDLSDCASAECAPLGACCAADGGCLDDQTAEDCVVAGGLYQDDGTACASVDCEPFGACCLLDKTCLDQQTIGLCEAANGDYQGHGTRCTDAEVDCTVPSGGCCMSDFSCTEDTTEEDCAAAEGTYLGDGSDCTECIEEPAACCDQTTGECVGDLGPSECAALGYEPQGAGTSCASTDCAIVLGACCMTDGSCDDAVSIPDCEAASGSFQGDGVACADIECVQPPTGACCLPNGECLADLTTDACSVAGGDYAGDGVNCIAADCPPPLPTGSCCLDNSVCVSDVPAEACAVADGVYLGDGSDCTFCSVSPQACCVPITGDCVDQPPAQCIDEGLEPQGPDTNCDDDGCPMPIGACCFDSGFCLDLGSDDCAGLAGTWQGEDTTCDNTECGVTGACCLSDESCVDVNAETCGDLEGTYGGDGSDCDGTECSSSTRACCFDTGFCLDLLEDDCAGLGGTIQGPGTSCDDTECGITGACCLADDSCLEVNADTCAVLEGDYGGDGTICDPDSCSVACPEDLDGDGEVGPFDLALVLGFWGPCEEPCTPETTCMTDLNGDCVTGPFDLALILGFWGPCE